MLLDCFRIMRGVVWILGEYCENIEGILRFMDQVRKCIGELPIVENELRLAAGEEPQEKQDEKPAKVGLLYLFYH